ncbi:MAG: hypothetical protein L6Q53_18110 [Candidatus Brocadia sinica]|nr:hypothetical protein [Candidatus Brocadia sinica]
MNMPEFTAEASLYKRSRPYGVAATLQAIHLSTIVYPQIRRATGPHGPIGFPGQDCYGACWHVCMTFGGFFDQCMDSCQSSCYESSFTARL